MAKTQFIGYDAWQDGIDRLQSQAEAVAKQTLYQGARLVADALKAEIQALPVEEYHYMPAGHRLKGVPKYEKEAMIRAMGIARMQTNSGKVHTSIGFDGYDGLVTREWPGGRPVQMIANSINSGCSFRTKIPFISRVKSKTAGSAELAMEKTFDELAKKYLKN